MLFNCKATTVARKPQVVFFIRSAVRPRDKVLDFQLSQDKPLGREAVAAPVTRLRPYTPPDFHGNIATAHGCNGSRNPRRTASRTA